MIIEEYTKTQGYYYFIDEQLDIVYVAPFEGAIEAKAYRDEVHPECTVAVKVRED